MTDERPTTERLREARCPCWDYWQSDGRCVECGRVARGHTWVKNRAFAEMTGITKLCLACGQPDPTVARHPTTRCAGHRTAECLPDGCFAHSSENQP